ncbi:hypothetical protein Tco_1334384, partial [Tanacetum coccineum]
NGIGINKTDVTTLLLDRNLDLHGLANQEVLLWIKSLVDEVGENVSKDQLKDCLENPSCRSEGNVDAMSVESGSMKRGGRRKKSVGRIDGESKITRCSGRVKDNVMEFIGSEIKQRPKSEWITADASSSAVQTGKS